MVTVGPTNFSGSRAPITGFEVDEDSRLRASNFFFGWDRPHWKFVFEGSLGEIEQATTDRQWHSLRADIVYQLTQNLDVLLRLDSIDSDNKTADTLETEGSFGCQSKAHCQIPAHPEQGHKVPSHGKLF